MVASAKNRFQFVLFNPEPQATASGSSACAFGRGLNEASTIEMKDSLICP
jgi:hypothetical protein